MSKYLLKCYKMGASGEQQNNLIVSMLIISSCVLIYYIYSVVLEKISTAVLSILFFILRLIRNKTPEKNESAV